MKTNIIQVKSYQFALNIIKIYKSLIYTKKEFVLSRQLLRSGTSIGANVEEAIGGQSKKDFISKMSIAYKEARETHYWIRLLMDSDIINKANGNEILSDSEELLRIISSILNTAKDNS